MKVYYYYFYDNYAGTGRDTPKAVDLYSYGPNGVDDNGSNDEATNADDIANWHDK